MGTAVHLPDGGQTTSTTTVTTSYSTFSIASLIGNHQDSDDERATLISSISEPETTAGDHPASGSDRGEDRLAVRQCTATTTTSPHDDDADSADDDAGWSRVTTTLLLIDRLVMK